MIYQKMATIMRLNRWYFLIFESKIRRQIMMVVILLTLMYASFMVAGKVSGGTIYSLYWNVEYQYGDKMDNWDDALEINIAFENSTLTGTLHVKNDWNALYLGFLFEEDFFLDPNATTTVWLYWDGNNDRVDGDDVKLVRTKAITGTVGVETEDYFLSSSRELSLDQGNVDVSASLFQVSFGDFKRDLLEIVIPLTTDDPLEDFQVYQPEDFPLGLGIMVERRSTVAENVSVGWNLDVNDPVDASLYATFLLAGPSDVKIPAYQQSVPSSGETTVAALPGKDEEELALAANGGAAPGWEFLSWVSALIFVSLIMIVKFRKIRRVN